MKIIKKLGLLSSFLIAGFMVFAGVVSAHAVVSPKQVNVGAFQTFSLGVPSEKSVATVSVRLVMPEGLNYVTPNVMPGWKVEIKKAGSGSSDPNAVTEIIWSGEVIPSGERDDFVFSAQAPTTSTTLQWKVYQTYLDGSVVSWDQDPSLAQPKDATGKSDFSSKGPYSETKVVDDLSSPSPAAAAPSQTSSDSRQNLALILSIVALALSLIALQKHGKKS